MWVVMAANLRECIDISETQMQYLLANLVEVFT